MKTGRLAASALLLFLVGTVIGALGDQIHVQFGALSYPRKDLFGQAWWVGPNFGVAITVMVLGYGVLARLTGDRARPPKTAVIVPAIIFYAAYFATGLFWESPRALTAGLVLAWLVRVVIDPNRPALYESLLLALAGPGYEATLSAFGLFSYARPDFVVPMWLPALYLHLGPLVRTVYLAFVAPPQAAPATRENPAYLSMKGLTGFDKADLN